MGKSTSGTALLGAQLRRRRKELGLIMQDVADAAGLSVGFISQVERDIALPSLASLAAIARVLQVTPASLLPHPPVEADRPAAVLAPSLADMPAGTLTRPFPGSRLSAELRIDTPGSPRRSRRLEAESLMLVLIGALSVEIDGTLRVLNPGQWLHLPPGCHLVDWNHTGTPTTVLHCIVSPDPAPLAI